MPGSRPGCAFCGAARQLVETGVLDEKWSRRYGGAAAALDHGWYRSGSGAPVAVDHVGGAKRFSPTVRVCCDQCATGWIEDVRWRAEPTLVALAEKRRLPPPAGDLAAVVRLAQLTAVLAELVPGMLAASSSELRQTIRRGRSAPPSTHTWLFTLRQRLPARVHLSQVRPGTSADGQEGLLQIVSLDVAHVSALVVIASGRSAQETVGRSALNVELGPPLDAQDLDAQQRRAAASLRELDLARSPHPHQIAVHRLCAARDSTSPTPGG